MTRVPIAGTMKRLAIAIIACVLLLTGLAVAQSALPIYGYLWGDWIASPVPTNCTPLGTPQVTSTGRMIHVVTSCQEWQGQARWFYLHTYVVNGVEPTPDPQARR